MKKIVLAALTILICACAHKSEKNAEESSQDTVMVQNEMGEWEVAPVNTIISDDSILTIRYWYTSLGGTSPDIAHEICFKDSKGKIHKLPEDWSGIPYFTEIEDITCMDALHQECGIYLVRTLTKNSSASMERHLNAVAIENDSLVEKPIFKLGDKLVSTIELQEVLH